MINDPEVPDFIARHVWPPGLESELEARIRDLYRELRRRDYWICRFRKRAWNEADLDDLVNETLFLYLKDIRATLFVTEGMEGGLPAPLVEDGELVGLTLPLLPATVRPIKNIELYTFAHPKAWFNKIADSVLNKYARNSARAKKRMGDVCRAKGDPTRVDELPSLVERSRAPSPNIEKRLIDREHAYNFRKRYIAALEKLPPIQRVAWILSKDEFLNPDEAEPLLAAALHWRTARAALTRRPLPDAEVSGLLGRADVSPDTSRAKAKLGQHRSDLDPFKASRVAAPTWPREFLVGCASFGVLRSLGVQVAEPGEPRHTRERDRDLIRDLPGPHRQDESIGALMKERVSQRSMDLIPGWVIAPTPDDPQYIDLLKRIRELRKEKRQFQTIAKRLTAAQVPPLFGNAWHPTAVKLIAIRAGLAKRHSKKKPPKNLDPQEARDDTHLKTSGPSRARKKVSAKRAQSGTGEHKA